ncbi:ead/Ea22-like family protein [Raoultella planticola]|uniref:ead/Ea22-like family protein n=1 Tax=Raoultella planticola TaxID=575 RepID=UPI00388E2F23
MTDITELAQSMKAAATNVKETAHIARYLKATIARQTFKELMTPENILALVEALEKAQQYAKERDAENQDLMLTVGRLRVEREELESRTVTVKLPEPFKLAKSSSGLTYHYADEVDAALTAAGIKWESE